MTSRSRCDAPGCQRQPTYGNKGDKRPRFCSTHKQEGMYDVIARRCEHEGCMTRAAFNFHGQKVVKFCAVHKEEGMENLKSKCCEVSKLASLLEYCGGPGFSLGRMDVYRWRGAKTQTCVGCLCSFFLSYCFELKKKLNQKSRKELPSLQKRRGSFAEKYSMVRSSVK